MLAFYDGASSLVNGTGMALDGGTRTKPPGSSKRVGKNSMAKKPETLFKEKVKTWLDQLPRTWYFKTQLVALLGIPDIVGCVNGHFIALELKIDGEEPSKLQGWTLSKIIKAGGLGLSVTPANWKNVQVILKQIALGKIVFRADVPEPHTLSS
jgi:hypothetical protein